MLETVNLNVNKKLHTVKIDPETPLLYILRNRLGLNGPKYGCGRGQCGSCMVLLDDKAVASCLIPPGSVGKSAIVTLEGLPREDGRLNVVQQAFLDEQAAQCGYCTNGMIISATALLKRNKRPDAPLIKSALQMNLCRCGSQSRVIRAIKRAVNKL